MRALRKRTLIGAVVAAFVLVGAFDAYAYWTTGGSGSGSATAGTTTNNLTIASPLVTGITPGSSTPVTVTVTNPNSYSVHVDTVSTVITTSDGGCLPADFTFPAKVLNTHDCGARHRIVHAGPGLHRHCCQPGLVQRRDGDAHVLEQLRRDQSGGGHEPTQ